MANSRALKAAKKAADSAVVGQKPAVASAPNLKFVKTMQDALIDGLERPSVWARDFLDIDPYEAQCLFLDETRDVTEANFVAGNRVGKSWTGGVILAWRAFYRYVPPFTAPEYVTPDNVYKAVSTSMTIDQAKLCWNYALTFMTRSKRFKPFLEDYKYSPFPTIYLRTKDEKGNWVPSEIWARSLAKRGNYLLGHSINFILVDECAYILNYPIIEDEVIRMRLADTGGALFRISTPNGRNFFYDYYRQGLKKLADGSRDPRFFSHRITTWDNPYVSRQYLEEQKERMIPEYYAQNILAEFVSLSDFFKVDHIAAMYDGVDHELNGEPVKGHEYVLGIDLGAMRDPTVCYVLDITANLPKPLLVGLYEVKDGSWKSARAMANQVYRKYQPIYTAIDATGAGRPVSQQLIEEDEFQHTEEFIFTATSKPDLMTRLQDRVQQAGIKFPYGPLTKELVAQMSFYRLDDKNLTQDHVIGLALANLAYERARKTVDLDTTLYDDLNFINIRSGGRQVPDDLLMGPGLVFGIDPESGLYYPMGQGDFDGLL